MIDEPFGLANRDIVGVDRIFWECDYPHSSCIWPNTQQIVDPALLDTSVITSRTGGAVVFNADGSVKTLNSGLSPFNPFTDKPVECPQGATATVCSGMGANWQKAGTFGQGLSKDAFQTPRTYRAAVGVRF